MIIKKTLRLKVYSGISVDADNNVVFNWKSDSEDDTIHLVKQTSGIHSGDQLSYFYAYQYSNSALESDKKIVRTYLKNVDSTSELFSETIDEFVDNGVLHFDTNVGLSKFDVLVNTESSKHPSLTDVMTDHIIEHSENSYLIHVSLVKETYDHVTFDEDAAVSAMKANTRMSDAAIARTLRKNKEKFNDLKAAGKLFEMKRFLPPAFRSGFMNFLKFKTDEERELYSRLQGANVLVYDDFITSGTTVKEILRYLNSINPNNTLTVFVLVKQH